MTHLGTQISALADGQLSPTATERALAHVATCPACATELAAARAARRALTAAMDVPCAPELTARLMALGHHRPAHAEGATSGERPRVTHDGVRSSSGAPLPGSRPEGSLPPGCLDGNLARRRRVTGRWVVVAAAGAGVLISGLVTLGERPDVAPAAHPAHALTLLGRAAQAQPGTVDLGEARRAVLVRAGDGPLEAPEGHLAVLEWLERHHWTSPERLPEGFAVTAVRTDGDATGRRTLEIDLSGDNGTIVICEEQGRLDPAAVARSMTVDLDGKVVHVLSVEPWHGVWQSGETVVSVVADVPPAVLEQLVGAFPTRDYDDGVPARISRGWAVLAGSWNP
ncbi:zf-HC2 domain-containing protein [Actinotalea sp. K2]|uniref:zf-HC2 domain-containing protein n=1 Tax=Actinotalea sp. K2 TaxID=2939438 RepID=UPI00201835B2|nr:zf-HC2 domain-containing protein [Actinotalea sp. K2]MCL3862607.1 zf-HC2 domain-containing protein [Actinotalea sp. K2]